MHRYWDDTTGAPVSSIGGFLYKGFFLLAAIYFFGMALFGTWHSELVRATVTIFGLLAMEKGYTFIRKNPSAMVLQLLAIALLLPVVIMQDWDALTTVTLTIFFWTLAIVLWKSVRPKWEKL